MTSGHFQRGDENIRLVKTVLFLLMQMMIEQGKWQFLFSSVDV